MVCIKPKSVTGNSIANFRNDLVRNRGLSPFLGNRGRYPIYLDMGILLVLCNWGSGTDHAKCLNAYWISLGNGPEIGEIGDATLFILT